MAEWLNAEKWNGKLFSFHISYQFKTTENKQKCAPSSNQQDKQWAAARGRFISMFSYVFM